MQNRVVITGMGIISPLGVTVPQLWENIKLGKSGIGKIDRFDAGSFTTQIAGQANDFFPENYIDKKEIKRMDRYTQFAVAACREAIKDANLMTDEIDKERFGVILGTGIGGIETLENSVNVYNERGSSRISPFLIPMMIANIAAGQISIFTGAKGINYTIVTACAASNNALGEAFKSIRAGNADVIISGGSEAPITPISIAGFCAMKAMSTNNSNPQNACKPFDLNRDGFVMAEGAAILILESFTHAVARGARIYAEIVGYGVTADAYHITAPSPNAEGGARAMKQAINDASIAPKMIGYINAHGTSTPYNDKFESAAIKDVFGEHAFDLCVSSTKSMTGHMMGAAGGIEAVISVKTLLDQYAPPTINYETPDPECDLDYVPNEGKSINTDYVLSNSFGFGGHNASLVFKRFA